MNLAATRHLLLSAVLLAATAASAGDDWAETLAAHVERIEARTDGEFGVHVRHLGEGRSYDSDGDRMWYLSSTVKVPVAIAVLQQVEEGRLSLDQQLTLAESDFVDGAGDLIWQKPGAKYSVRTLISKSLVNSDSTATDMLIRLVGQDELNRRIQRWVPEGFGPITTILQVRYDAYGIMHPGVARLSNMDLVRLRNADAGSARLNALVQTLGVERDALAVPTIEQAFEQYYATHKNSATLQAFAQLLEKLVRGELLDREHTDFVLSEMRRITTGDRRIKAGLPRGAAFAQKTGTQLARACNMGILLPNGGAEDAAVVVAACVEKYDRLATAERALKDLGSALADAGLAR